MYRRATVPARINIIGEHTDYEGGLSLPFTINSHLTLEVKKSENGFSGNLLLSNYGKLLEGDQQIFKFLVIFQLVKECHHQQHYV